MAKPKTKYVDLKAKFEILAGTAHLLDELDSNNFKKSALSFIKFGILIDSDFYKWATIFFSEKLIVVLRDGSNLVGYLRSVDQFANLVLHMTVERIFVGNKYGDIPRGIYIVRGENVVLLGEIVSTTYVF